MRHSAGLSSDFYICSSRYFFQLETRVQNKIANSRCFLVITVYCLEILLYHPRSDLLAFYLKVKSLYINSLCFYINLTSNHWAATVIPVNHASTSFSIKPFLKRHNANLLTTLIGTLVKLSSEKEAIKPFLKKFALLLGIKVPLPR